MSHTRIKICGITSPEDARLAADSGADAIGLVFYANSPRFVTVQQAAACAAALPPFVSVVALFVNETAENIGRVLATVPVDVMQFHGDESAAFCTAFQRPYIKALRVQPGVEPVGQAAQYPTARAILLDAWQADAPGGTGKTFDWDLAQGQFSRPVVLAGGLDSANVARGMEWLRPAAVDVSSGVESAPGVKSRGKIEQFIAAVRTADQRLGGLTDEQ